MQNLIKDLKFLMETMEYDGYPKGCIEQITLEEAIESLETRQEPQTKPKPDLPKPVLIIFGIIIRLLYFVPFLMMGIICACINLCKYCYYYLWHGGEAIAYTHKNERLMIKDIYEKLTENK